MFSDLRTSIKFLDPRTQLRIVRNMIRTMKMDDDGPQEYKALYEAGMAPPFEFDYKMAYTVHGSEVVESWIKDGTYVDVSHPCVGVNLDHLRTSSRRKVFYDNFIKTERNRGGKKLSKNFEKLHINFTFAEIEHYARMKKAQLLIVKKRV